MKGGGEACPHCKGNPGLDCNSFGRTARLDLSVFDQPGDPRSNLIARGWVPPGEQPAAVDGAMERLRTHRDRRLWQADLVGGQISADRMRAILSAALTQQPATNGPASDTPNPNARKPTC